ncbi:alkaline phosphatase family protein [Mucilaginibacter sp. L3T2-6]|uniref:bifunctional YncE family protein/alkaline phosphatase family protein n=1 Tax=Mucilaginibacter sp. L3T2-6 TaxID=3062491 RepID=UPI002674DBDD|nr:alkaline phosphatase family protein [Mucilaginibacter sp. L3T2-6]MDO3643623.1 alkaline phosphatase family protein [Mucilaginibacter sp. L3T2-6]MDV6216129.1 alkaline phosphatase family protein [Mucilaginibacter sp. L3T2-6]
MKISHSILITGVCLSVFTICSQSIQAQTSKSPEKRKDVKSPVDTSWNQASAGDKMFVNSQAFNPAGQTLDLAQGTRVMNIELARHDKFLLSKNNGGLAVINADDFTVANRFEYEKDEAGSMYGLAVDGNDSTVYFTGAQKNLYIGNITQSGEFKLTEKIDLSVNKKTATPLGIGLVDKHIAYVALAIPNQVAVVDIAAGKVLAKVPVGVCPYAIVISKDKRLAFVSNFGGPQARKGDRTEVSAGTKVAVDDNSIALRGSVTVIDIQSRKAVKQIATRIYPESMALSPDGSLLYVTDESGDGISVVDTKKLAVVHTIDTKPDPSLPYGSLTTALAFSPDGKVLYAANAGNNAIALIDPKHPQKGPYGFIAGGGFPGAVCVTAHNLFIGNVTPLKQGALQKVALPASKAQLDAYTTTAKKGFHFIEMMRAQAEANLKARPQPVPANVGEPSSIKHVVYIIRENKKFDQELGDFGKGNCDSTLVEYAKHITPNAHSLAGQFILLDNYYCNGINSSDGHQWATQGISTPYHEKDFSGGRCAYDFGTDPLCYAGCGFIWTHLLRKGISFRNFGEFDLAEVTKGKSWTNLYDNWKDKGDSVWYKCAYQSKSLEKYSDLRYPGWNLTIPEQIRADVFIKALHEYEAKGSFPDFTIIYLPNDHTSGYDEKSPTPRAYVADNDLATGRVVEALSKSPFWKDMAIFVNEDDPQSGTDHVDGHRSVCFVASPYAKRKSIVSKFYNQASVLHTICQIFGTQPMNQMVAMAPLMNDCFQESPDYTPYTTLTPAVAINEMNPPKQKIGSKTTKRLAPLTEKMDFSKPDLNDKDALLFSEYLWSTIHGDKPFPKKYFGAHGKGLKALGLQIDPQYKDDDD